ncbi:MAG: hypothetical protein JKY96_06225 [Phycisphaerales bacterium]|nr:hypothetical protein [Phycisphaerales bacterium]
MPKQVQWDPSVHMPKRKPAWPLVIGIIFILYASFGILGNGMGLVMMRFSTGMIQWQLDGDPLPPSMVLGPKMITVGLFGLGLSAYLLIAAILLTVRRPSARKHFIIYGVLALALTVIRLVNGLVDMASLDRWSQQYPDNQYAQSINMPYQSIMQVSALVVFVAFWLAVVLFVLIWFGRVKTDPNQITG